MADLGGDNSVYNSIKQHRFKSGEIGESLLLKAKQFDCTRCTQVLSKAMPELGQPEVMMSVNAYLQS